ERTGAMAAGRSGASDRVCVAGPARSRRTPRWRRSECCTPCVGTPRASSMAVAPQNTSCVPSSKSRHCRASRNMSRPATRSSRRELTERRGRATLSALHRKGVLAFEGRRSTLVEEDARAVRQQLWELQPLSFRETHSLVWVEQRAQRVQGKHSGARVTG